MRFLRAHVPDVSQALHLQAHIRRIPRVADVDCWPSCGVAGKFDLPTVYCRVITASAQADSGLAKEASPALLHIKPRA